MESQNKHTSVEPSEKELIDQLLWLVTQKTGVDLVHYKHTTLQRRIMRRMHILGIKSLAAYLHYVRSNEQEQHLLYKSMLIHVSSFFRDDKSFDVLCANVLPVLLNNKQADETVRVWVCGCSTGEEAYSIAICLHEHAELIGNLSRIKIFASDLSETAVAKARLGIYPAAEIEKMPLKRRQVYFTPYRGGYKIKPFIRELCVFAVHNVLADPPFPQIDLISCRNVLIYMQSVLQKKVLATFAYALKNNGYLFLGKSETSGLAGKFELVNKGANIFINKTKNVQLFGAHPPNELSMGANGSSRLVYTMEKKDFQNAADELLLARYVPAGVVVNDNFDIVDFKGNTGFYIEPSPGIPSFNALKMVRKGLYYDLNEALGKAKTERVTVRKENIALEHDGRLLRITIDVLPLSGTREKHYLVLFHDINLPNETSPANDGINDTRDLRILQLEQELLQSREQLRALSEEQEATNEEFQSANEELKTLNEELQTSQEEIISINEELLVRNKELNDVNKELRLAKELADSITNTVSESLLVLSHDLRVRMANTSFYDTFHVIPNESEGRYVYDLGNGQWNIPALQKLLEDILPKKSFFHDFVVEHNFDGIGKRTVRLSGRQVKGEADSEALILLAITDITEVTKANELIEQKQQLIAINEERQRLAIDATHYGIWDYEMSTDELFLSKEAAAMLGVAKEEQVGWQALLANIIADDKDRVESSVQVAISGGKDGFFSQEYRVAAPTEQGVRWINNSGKAIFDEKNRIRRFTGIVSDITDQRATAFKLEEAFARLDLALHAGRTGSWQLIISTNELIASSQCKANFGLPAQADLPYSLFQSLIVEDDRPAVQQAVQQAILTHNRYHAEYRILWPDESVHWIEASGIIQYNPVGEATSLIGVTNDITERKDANQKLVYSEHHFRTLANSSPVMVGMCDKSINFYFFNKRWQTFVGVPESSLLGRRWMSFIHLDDLPHFEAIQRTAINKHHRFTVDMRLRSLGKYRWVTCIAEPRFGPDNSFTGYTMACTDVHDQRMITEELERKVDERTEALRDLNEDLLDRNRELKQFAYVTSHDLQEPLRKIKIFASMLLAKESDGNGYLREYLAKIEFSATRMIGLIHDLLNYSSIQERSLAFTSVDLNKTVQHVLTDFDLLIQEKGAMISLGSLPAIDAVPLQMNQLFFNLMSNALKFSRPDVAPHITIKSVYLGPEDIRQFALDAEQQYVKISVSDNGIGFSPEYNERIFEIFQRLHTRESYTGNGIGLALCKRIVTNHGGLIIPRSQEGEGTTFEIVLPDKQA